jgi:CDP-paratose 2-epimerase
MKVLITGICGFVGSQLAQALQEILGEGARVVGIDNFGRPGSETNRLALMQRGITVMHADLRNASDLAGLPDVDWVIDAAANPSVLAGVDGKSSPRQLLEHNLWGTVESLEYCRRTGAGFILLSTSRVYSIQAMSALPVGVRGNSFELDASGPLPHGVGAHRSGLFNRCPNLAVRRHQAGIRGLGTRVPRGLRNPGLDQPLRRAGGRRTVRHCGSGHLLLLDQRASAETQASLHRIRGKGISVP